MNFRDKVVAKLCGRVIPEGFLRSRSFVMISKLHQSDSIMFAQHFERFDFVTQLADNGIPLVEG